MTPSRYVHYKTGHVYEFVSLAKNERDWDDVVVYKDLVDGRTACRPATEFFGLVNISSIKNTTENVRRYTPLSGQEEYPLNDPDSALKIAREFIATRMLRYAS